MVEKKNAIPRQDPKFYLVDPRAANPFWMSKVQKRVALTAMPFVLAGWSLLLIGFKSEINPFGDEGGYHLGGVLLAHSMSAGTFIRDAFDTYLFKYPGFYGLAGVVYFLFGEHALLLRALGLLPFLGLAVVVSNTAALIGGERARNIALLLVLFSPIFFFYATQIYRDIYIAFAVAVVFHRVVAVTQLRLDYRTFLTGSVTVAMLLIFLLRTPEVLLIAAIVLVGLALAWSLSLARRQRQWAFAITLIGLTVIVWLSKGILFDVGDDVFFGEYAGHGEYSIQHLSALSEYNFSSSEQIASAMMNPIFLAKALVIKVTEFALGLHPFAQSDNSASLTGLFGDYNPMDWGGASRVDALLVFGLQWISHFLLLPFLAVGFFGLWRYNPRGLIVLSVLWLVFSVVTLFTGNATRWGLPSMLVYYVMVAVGYAWFAGRIYQFFFFTIGLLVAVVAVRLTLFPVPMIVVLAGSLGLIWWFQPEPLGLHRGGRRHNDSYLSRSSQ